MKSYKLCLMHLMHMVVVMLRWLSTVYEKKTRPGPVNFVLFCIGQRVLCSLWYAFSSLSVCVNTLADKELPGAEAFKGSILSTPWDATQSDLDRDYSSGFPGFRCWDDWTVFKVWEKILPVSSHIKRFVNDVRRACFLLSRQRNVFDWMDQEKICCECIFFLFFVTIISVNSKKIQIIITIIK